MTLVQPLSVLRQELRETSIADLPTALLTLDELLPDGSEKKAVVTALRASFNQLNKDSYRGVIDQAAYALRLAQISANFIDLLDALTEADFEPAVAAKNSPSGPKRGSVLYKIPRRMPIRKISLCTVRVAVDEEVILDDLVLDDGVRIRPRVEVSDMMSAELVDLEGNVFEVTALNAPRQRVRDTGYTQWLFRVTPLVEGEHQLLVKVSLMEFDANIREYVPREVSILETVTIVTEAPAPSDSEEVPLRASGERFSLGPVEEKGKGKEQKANSPQTEQMEILSTQEIKMAHRPGQGVIGQIQLPTVETPTQSAPTRTSNPLRALAFFLAFLMVGTTATFAFTPKDTKDWLWTRYIQDDEAAYTEFIDTHPESKYVEDAAYRRVLLAPTVRNLRAAEIHVRQEQRRAAVLAKLNEAETAELQTLRANPNRENLQQFLKDFPHSERLGNAVEAVATDPVLRSTIETRAFEAVQQQPTARNIELFQKVFPNTPRKAELQDLAKSAASPGSFRGGAGERGARDAAEERDWANATVDNTAQTYIYFVEKYPRSSHVPEALRRIKTFSLKKSDRIRMETQAARQVLQEEMESMRRTNPETPKSSNPSESSLPATDPQPKEPPPSNDKANGRKSGIHDMVVVTGGAFLMGSRKGEEDRYQEECQHSVIVKSFSIGKYEVTQADWREVMGNDPPELNNRGCDDCPVEGVSWNDVQNFLKKLNANSPDRKYRLPTEEEWEYAARGGFQGKSYKTYVGSNKIDEVAWYNDNYALGNNFGIKKTTRPVGTKNPNDLKLYDMSGNVFEWCQSKYRPYPGCTGNGSEGCVSRGGSWRSTLQNCRSASRSVWPPGRRYDALGFRLALAPQ